MTEKLLQQGIATLKAGQRAEAYRLLRQVVRLDPSSEQGWLWLSGAVGTDEQRRFCLLQVLAINRRNAIASRGLEKLGPGDACSPLDEEHISGVQGQQAIEINARKACPNCTTFNPHDNRFCDQCGYPLDRPSKPKPESAPSLPQQTLEIEKGDMKLSAPKRVTWIVALVLGTVGLVGYLMTIPFLTWLAFWIVLMALDLMLVATLVEGL